MCPMRPRGCACRISARLLVCAALVCAAPRLCGAEAGGEAREPRQVAGAATDQRLAALLAQLKESDEGRRISAAIQLGATGEARAVDALVGALHDPSEAVRREAARALGAIGDVGAAAALVATLRDRASSVATEAAFALAKVHSTAAVEPLLAALRHKDVLVQNATIYALGQLGDARAVEPLVSALGDARTRNEAVLALGLIGDPRAVKPLIAAFGDADTGLNFTIHEALHRFGPAVVEPLIAALNNPNANVRREAALALRPPDEARAFDPMSFVLGNREPEVHDARAVGPLITLLRDPDPRVRAASVWTLSALGDPRADEPLLAALDDADPKVRMIAAQFFGAGGSIARNRLIAALHKKDLAIVAGACQFFIALGERGSEGTLIGALQQMGTPSMAETYLNCGNPKLENAGGAWATAHGFSIRRQPGLGGTQWGSGVGGRQE